MDVIQLIDEHENTAVVNINDVSQTAPLHKHDYYEFFLVTSGKAIHIVNHNLQVIEKGSLVLIRPNDEHSFDYYQSQNIKFINVGFSTDVFDGANKMYNGLATDIIKSETPKHVRLYENLYAPVKANLETIQKEKNQTIQKLLVSKLVAEIIYIMITEKETEFAKTMPTWLLKMLDEINKPENFTQGLKCMLSMTSYTQEHINRSFKRYIGTTPTKYINELRIRHSHSILEDTNVTIAQASKDCGFNNISHFYNEFKKYYGYSPRYVTKSWHKIPSDVDGQEDT